jgi:hypothetical protein
MAHFNSPEFREFMEVNEFHVVDGDGSGVGGTLNTSQQNGSWPVDEAARAYKMYLMINNLSDAPALRFMAANAQVCNISLL